MNPYNSSNSLTLNTNIEKLNNGTNENNIGLRSLKKRRKSVSFSDINVVNVENWKSYNTDISKDNEYMKLRQEILEHQKLQKEKGLCGCDCSLF